MTNLQLFIHLTAVLAPVLGVLAFLLLYRRQNIHADLDERRMRQEHGQTMNLLAARKQEAMSGLVGAYAPLLSQVVDHVLAKANTPTLDGFATTDLVEELDRRVARHFAAANDHPAASCCDVEDGVPISLEPDNPTIN